MFVKGEMIIKKLAQEFLHPMLCYQIALFKCHTYVNSKSWKVSRDRNVIPMKVF